MTGLLFALNEVWVPDANAAANLILRRRVPPASGALGPEWQPNLVFNNDADGRLWQIGAYNRVTAEMLALNIEWRFPDGGHRRLAAERGDFTNGVWVLQDVKELLYTPESRLPSFRGLTNRLELPELTETPERINSEIKFTELSQVKAAKGARLSLREILDYRRLHPRLNPRERAKLETQFHGRVAEPWKCLVVVLIAIPFGAPSGRRNVFVGVASSIFIAFGYFFIAGFALALGTGGYVPPWVAAWLPNALFAGVAIWLTQRVR
jgi:lipopolysaccharide export system permease protein